MNWKRYTVLALSLLLAVSLRLAWSALTWQPEVASSENAAAAGGAVAAAGIKITRPPAVIPDLLDGYIFNAGRKLDPADTLAFGGGHESAARGRGNIDKLLYNGSIMVGIKQQALVAFPAKIRGPDGRDKEIIQHRVLSPGDEFNGYRVASIEPLRLVFTLNGEKVVKQLYDKDKSRPVVGFTSAKNKEKTRRRPAPPVRSTLRKVVSPRPGLARADVRDMTKPLSRSSRRMQQLKLANPGIVIPAPPAATAPAR